MFRFESRVPPTINGSVWKGKNHRKCFQHIPPDTNYWEKMCKKNVYLYFSEIFKLEKTHCNNIEQVANVIIKNKYLGIKT